MSLKEKIKEDFLKAFREKDQERKAVLSMINSDIKNAEIETKSREEGLSDEKIIELLKRNVKQRKDAVEKYQAGDREELAQKEQKEIEILKEYLPAELGADEIEKVVKAVIEKTGASDMSKMGMVMGAAMQELKGQADGTVVKDIVTKLLQ